tara:strand:- start:264 stop:1331 length:1068 start_codon:yes stop_codon:yes gene_type:complete
MIIEGKTHNQLEKNHPNMLLIMQIVIISFFIAVTSVSADEVNIYSARKGYLLQPLVDAFQNDTGIKVNVISGKAKVLQKRIKQEGQNTRADVLLTVDAGNLFKAKEDGLLKRISSKKLNKLIPSYLRDEDGYWFGLSIRSRVIMYNPDKVKISNLSTYEDLADKKWKNRICIRSSSNIYNQSLLASIISNLGEDNAEQWARDVKSNFSKDPKGNDRTQMTSVVMGECDVTIANTYYLGKWISSEKDNERKYAEKISVFFPNQESSGAHINISGAAIIKYSKNEANAIRFLEYLASDVAQELYAQANHEYPIRDNIAVSKIVESWGYPFKKDTLNLGELGKNNRKAVMIFDRVGWK